MMNLCGNTRERRLSIFARFAENLASLSKCTERKVAAIIIDKNLSQVYSIGINGGPKGLADCLCIVDGKYGCVHAEVNAIIKDKSIDTNKIMICTLQPCKQCAATIINAPGGFSAVYYLQKWKDDSGIKLLNAAGIHTEYLNIL